MITKNLSYLGILLMLIFSTACQELNKKNKLGREASPYLKQHADNPIWWKPWGKKAFKMAKKENKPIFLSIGYSSCHWCHVMEEETFMDQEVAKYLNDNFISIKVDREERPDVDKIYMDAVQAMGKNGGWPLTVFLTPDLKPFFGGTYYPKTQFQKVLESIRLTWFTQENKLKNHGNKIVEALKVNTLKYRKPPMLDNKILKQYLNDIPHYFDAKFGGFGKAPKFPSPMKIRLLLRLAKRSSKQEAIKIHQMVKTTLDAMFRGGMYDHIGGGFHRYSTDKYWLVPHFEKMLYDNGSMALTYLEAYEALKVEEYKRIAQDIFRFIIREMELPHGGFHAAQDADSEHEEGKFYMWDKAEIKAALSEKEYAYFTKKIPLKKHGLYEKRYIINLIESPKNFSSLDKEFQTIREKLYQYREKKVRPFKDKKIITAWNGLMIHAFAKGAIVLNDPFLLKHAQGAANFIMVNMSRPYLTRHFIDLKAHEKASLDDYAYLIKGVLLIYESDFNPGWLRWAQRLQEEQDKYLWSNEYEIYRFARQRDDLLRDTMEVFDNARPNPNGVSALNLLKFYSFTYDDKYLKRAQNLLRTTIKGVSKYPLSASSTLIALDYYDDFSKEIVVVGKLTDPRTIELLKGIRSQFLPNKVVAHKLPHHKVKIRKSYPPATSYKDEINGPTVYVCQNKVCKEPVNTVEKLLPQLQNIRNI